MNKNTIGLIAVSLLVLVTVVIIYAMQADHASTAGDLQPVLTTTPRQAEAPLPDPNSDQKLDAIIAGMSQISSELNSLGQRVYELEEPSDPEPVAAQDIDSNDEYSEAEYQARYSAFITSLDSDFVAEPADANFSQQKQDAVANLFLNTEKPLYQNAQIKNLECRSSSCKVELVLDGDVDSEEFESEFLIDAAKLGFPRVRGYKQSESGQESHVYYFSPAIVRQPDQH